MRPIVASIIDVIVATVLAFAGFHLGSASAPCTSQSNCFPLIPFSILGAGLPVLIYFVAGYLLWHMTPGERATSSRPTAR